MNTEVKREVMDAIREKLISAFENTGLQNHVHIVVIFERNGTVGSFANADDDFVWRMMSTAIESYEPKPDNDNVIN